MSKVKNPKEKFAFLKKQLKELGFSRETRQMWKLYQKQFGVEFSDAAHVSHTKNTVSFIFEIKGYQIVVRTTYDPSLKDFSEKGSLYIVVRRNSGGIFYRQIHRKGNFQYKVIRFVRELIKQLKVRPLGSDNKPMLLERTSYGNLGWKSADGSEKRDFFVGSPKEIIDLIKAKDYYDKFGAKNRGVKKRLRTFKKTSRVRTPENVD
ncbi:hypothetical protein GW765_03380 [Candidatus Parcubacteria bacterium]|nr:hypothetical protein [Candidatus Parcubacteria bacterium]